MSTANKQQPIIVIKKKGGHGGHHGGAWKVAYADFVTAMMSLFIVLWLMNSSEKVKQAVAGGARVLHGKWLVMTTEEAKHIDVSQMLGELAVGTPVVAAGTAGVGAALAYMISALARRRRVATDG